MELLPCPFCGSAHVLGDGEADDNWFECMDCNARGPRTTYIDAFEAIDIDASEEAWNRRAANAATDPALLALAKLGAMVLDWSPLECGFPTMPGSVIDAMAVRAGVAMEDSGDGGHACWTAPGVKLAIVRLLAPDGAGEVDDA